MNYEQRTIVRLLRHVPGVTVEKVSPTSMYHVVTINGVPARAMVGDGFLTFGVRHDGWCGGRYDSGLVVVPVRRMVRDRPMLSTWLTACHECAAEVQRESTERAANYAREREQGEFLLVLDEAETQQQYFDAMHLSAHEDA
jgi:hypothetical protein